MNSTVIGLSGKKQSGKTTLAYHSIKYGYIVLNFADKLKNIICDILCVSIQFLEENKDKNIDILLSDDSLHKLSTELNMYVDKKKYKSFRHMLQYIGTDVIRLNDPNWHINQIHKTINLNPNKKYCIADCRFKNEKKFIENILNGKCYYIINKNINKNIADTHVSENDLDISDFNNNQIIYNNKTIESLFENNKYIFN